MNFFLDENVPRKAHDFLSCNGHVVFDIRGTVLEGIQDQVIFEIAQKQGAIFITTDKDFYHTIPHLYKLHFGIIVINLRQPNARSILVKLEWAYNFIQKNKIENCCLMLTDQKVFYLQR